MGAGMWVESATDVSRAGRVGASLGAVVLGLGLAACGDDGSDGSGGAPDNEASGTENCAALDDTLAEGMELSPGGAVMVPEGWEIPDCRGDWATVMLSGGDTKFLYGWNGTQWDQVPQYSEAHSAYCYAEEDLQSRGVPEDSFEDAELC